MEREIQLEEMETGEPREVEFDIRRTPRTTTESRLAVEIDLCDQNDLQHATIDLLPFSVTIEMFR